MATLSAEEAKDAFVRAFAREDFTVGVFALLVAATSVVAIFGQLLSAITSTSSFPAFGWLLVILCISLHGAVLRYSGAFTKLGSSEFKAFALASILTLVCMAAFSSALPAIVVQLLVVIASLLKANEPGVCAIEEVARLRPLAERTQSAERAANELIKTASDAGSTIGGLLTQRALLNVPGVADYVSAQQTTTGNSPLRLNTNGGAGRLLL